MNDESNFAPVLAKPEILKQKEEGNVLIVPFDDRQINSASYDVRLGNHFWREKAASGWSTLDPYDEESSNGRWEAVSPIIPGKNFPMSLRPNEAVIVLQPGEFMLAHTHEFIGTTDRFLTQMCKGRSTSQRLGLSICNDAGWGDIRYATRYTLELKNNSRFYSIILRPGQRLGQIVFIPTSGVPDEDAYDVNGKYMPSSASTQLGKTFAELKKDWTPEMMLPRAYKDWDLDAVRDGEYCE